MRAKLCGMALFCVGTLALAQDAPAPVVRYGIVISAEAYPQGTVKDALASAVKAIDKDRSSLVAVDIRAFARLCVLFTCLLNATCIGLVVLGMLVIRRREFAVLRANGLSTGQTAFVIAAEAMFVTVLGTLFGLATGTLAGPLYTDILRPMFVTRPPPVVPLGALILVCILSVLAAAVSSVAAVGVLRHDRMSEYLRET